MKNIQVKIAFLVIVLSQTFLLVYMIASKQYTLDTGTAVLLETQPIDPRSLFSGDYVSLNYSISNISLGIVPGEKQFQYGDDVYLALQSNGGFWTPVLISKTSPTPVPGQTIIRGKAQNLQDNTLYIWYGIEQYYVPEGKGKDLETLANQKQLSVKVKIDKFGRAAIAGLLANDQEIYQETLF